MAFTVLMVPCTAAAATDFVSEIEVAAGIAALAIVVVLVVIRPRQTSALADSGDKVEKAAVVEIKSGQTGV